MVDVLLLNDMWSNVRFIIYVHITLKTLNELFNENIPPTARFETAFLYHKISLHKSVNHEQKETNKLDNHILNKFSEEH